MTDFVKMSRVFLDLGMHHVLSMPDNTPRLLKVTVLSPDQPIDQAKTAEVGYTKAFTVGDTHFLFDGLEKYLGCVWSGWGEHPLLEMRKIEAKL